MDRRRARLRTLTRAFRDTRAVTRHRQSVRYSDELKRMAVDALRDGLTIDEVTHVTGVSSPSLTKWLMRFKRRPLSRRPHSDKSRQFKRLKVVGEAPQMVTMHVGDDIRLDVPVELLSAELIRKLTGKAS